MLNIHSFLRRIKRHKHKNNFGGYQSCLMIAAYIMVAVILVIGSESFYGGSRKTAETYVRAQSISGVFTETKGETANTANILQSDEYKDKTIIGSYSQEGFAIVSINKMVEYTKEQFEKEQKAEQDRIEEEQKRLEEQEKAKAKQAAKEKAEAEKKAEEKKLAEQKAKEQKQKEEKEKAAKRLSDEQTEVLHRIVEAEATGEGMKGKILVANVVLNRVKSSKFPNSVKEVVFQRSGSTVQFSPTKDGRYWSVKVTKETKEAVKRAVNGEDYSQGALYFSARSRADKKSMSWFDRNLTFLFKYGGHEFFK